MANTVDYKKVLEAVKEIRKAITRRGPRPGHITLILMPPGDAIVGSSEDMNLEEVRNLIRMAFRGMTPIKDDILTHEICVILAGLKLPEQYAVIARDNHTRDYLAWVNEANLVQAAGEATYQVGRLMGVLSARDSGARKNQPGAQPEATGTKLVVKKKSSFWKGVHRKLTGIG